MSNGTFVDHLGQSVIVRHPPVRIVSLVPSQTELLASLGLSKEVVGITKFCVHPPQWQREKEIVGGTKKLDLPRIESLHPDLIIGNKEENTRSEIEYLKSRFPTWMSDIETVDDALAMISGIGQLTGRDREADALTARITDAFATFPVVQDLSALYLIWRRPWMGAGSETYIHALMQRAGLSNVLANKPRYPELSQATLATLDPDVILLSSEPFPFREKHLDEIKAICPRAVVLLADGEMFSWYGSRMQYAPAYILTLFSSIRGA